MKAEFSELDSSLKELLPEFSEESLALRFSEKHAADLKYTAAWSRWHRWDGIRWVRDDTLHVFDLARRLARDASVQCEQKSAAKRIATAQTVAAIERLVRSDRRHAAAVEIWDADMWKLNTPTGLVDLKTGHLNPQRRDHFCTKATAVGPVKKTPELWLRFLDRITAGDADLQKFLQRMVGYSLTGVTTEQALFFLYGTGANGKSVFISTVAGVLNDYAKTAAIETFTVSRGEHHPTDLASLQGARLVTVMETESDRRWAEAKIKALTGGDRIAARYMRQDFFEFVPQFKLVVAGNHKPGLRTVDEAIRRRLYLVPFTLTVPEEERDPNLAEKLKAEWDAILWWMIEGCLAWQKEGLKPPGAVLGATREYLAAEDALGRWIDDRCDVGRQYSASSSSLFENWKLWCDANGEFAGSQKRFSQSLLARPDIVSERTEKARLLMGLALRSDITS